MKQIIVIILGVVLVITVAIFLIGYFLPVKHTATVTGTINSPIDTVWRKIITFAEYKSWRKDLKDIEIVSANEWIETDSRNQKIPFLISVLEENRKAKVEITGKDLPFGGHWIIELRENGNATDVTITENGEVYNILFRVMSKFVFGHDTTIREYLKNLRG